MIEKRLNSAPLRFFGSLLKHKEICHFVSTRNGGFSNFPYDSLNLGFHVGDNPETVLKNREQIAMAMGIPLKCFTLSRQVHGHNVAVITDDLRGSGADSFNTAIDATDAMVTDIANICLVVLQADCVPLLFFDLKKKVIGAAHAGWKGTVQMVAQNTVKTLKEKFNSSPDNIIVGIGPSIGPCCYEVGPEVVFPADTVFSDTRGYIKETDDGKRYFNLWEANKIQLVLSGIPEENIKTSGICTYCNHTLFFSHRYQRTETGRFGAGIMLVRS